MSLLYIMHGFNTFSSGVSSPQVSLSFSERKLYSRPSHYEEDELRLVLCWSVPRRGQVCAARERTLPAAPIARDEIIVVHCNNLIQSKELVVMVANEERKSKGNKHAGTQQRRASNRP